jgi:uvrD/REP helicase
MIRPDDWRPADGITLEPNAIQAVKQLASNVVVAAGPGAGKTELLAQRAEFLLATGACRYPHRILAISFKVDAVRNIRERVRRRCGDQLVARFDSFTFHAFAKRIIDNYRLLLTGENALDPDYTIDQNDRVPRKQITFDQIVPMALEILQKSPHVRNAIRQTYTHVFLDEFQDATDLQYSLLKEAFLGGDAVLTAVGDTKQRIMSWAGALDGIMQTFAKDFAAQDLTLYQNHRSDPVLRRMQNRMVRVMDRPAAVPLAALPGNDGSIEVLHFATSLEEALEIAGRIKAWLDAGVLPSEIAILVRQQPSLVCQLLIDELNGLGIASRNEQRHQDLTAEPAAALILNFIQVLADDRRSAAYEHLMRLVIPSSLTEEKALRNSRAVTRFLETRREQFREGRTARSNPAEWERVITEFLAMITLPVLHALSPEYQRGQRLSKLIEETTTVFKQELDKDGDPVAAIVRLSEEDAVRILTIHKSKGLEFEKVVVYGVECEFFWGGTIEGYRSEFFVAISRAKNELVLTHTQRRLRPKGASPRWEERRHPMQEFLDYAN